MNRRLSLLALLAASCTATATPRLGDPLPAHPWKAADRELVVLYSHDCGDIGPLWTELLRAGLPLRAVNAEEVPASAPKGLEVWRGEPATAFSRALRVRVYPTVLLVQGGRVLNLWEGTFNSADLR